MHIAIDAVGFKHSGAATVLLDFLKAAVHDPRVARLTVFCSPRSVRAFALPEDPKIRSVERPRAEHSYLYRLYWFERGLDRACREAGADVLFCMSGTGRLHGEIPHVTFIQQSKPFFGEIYRASTPRQRLRLWLLKVLMKRSARSASVVMVQTATMKSWVRRDFQLPDERIEVVQPSPPEPVHGEKISIEPMEAVPAGLRLLYVGSDAPQKNLGTIVRGLTQLREIVPGVTLFLTLALDHPVCSVPGVVCLGYLDGARLWKAYGLATAVVMPSLVETVGLPMLEAMRMGVPVLAADRPYAHDICGNAAYFFDPHSPAAFATAAALILQNQKLRLDLARRGAALIAKRLRAAPYAKMVDIIVGERSRGI